MKNQYNLPCNIAQTLNIIGDKWTLLIIRQLSVGQNTYKEILQALDGIPSNLLSKRLKDLEKDKLITSELYNQHPPRYKYLLTDSGRDLELVFNSIILWGEKHLEKCYKRLIHSKCNHRVDLLYYCSSCDKIIDPNEVECSKD